MSKQLPPIQIRLSEQAHTKLTEAAARKGTSRNSEATGRLEASLFEESPYAPERGLVGLVAALTAQAAAAGLMDMLDPDHRGADLARVKGAVVALLDGLGAADDPGALKMGQGLGRRFLEDARRTMALPNKFRTPATDRIAEAAREWGLEPTERQP